MNHKNRQNPTRKNPVRPKKRLGQNFLVQPGVIEKIAAAADIKPDETILEIGPGTGNLTQELAKTGSKLVAVEKDPAMVKILQEKFKDAANVEITATDIMDFDETKIPAPYKIAANLPFYLAAAAIRKFLESANPPLSMAVIVQKEVAQRICAKPPKMNLLAVSVQFYANAKIIDYVSRGCFWPAPKVDCAILQIVPRPGQGEASDEKFRAAFFEVVKAGFSHPRKQLANNLSKELGISRQETEAWLSRNNIEPGQRPETLSVNDWIGLTRTRAMDYNK